MTDQEKETIANKIGEVAPKQVANFLANPEGFDYNILEGYRDFTDKYKNVADFKGDKYKIMNEIYTQLDGKAPSSARFLSLQQKYPWLNAAELKDWFDKTNQYKAEYEAEREYEAGVNKRKAEVDDWNIAKKLATTDYEKQRYIYEPETALFGEDAPTFGTAKDTRWAALGDLGTSVVGTAADIVPTPIGTQFWLGPAIRTGRDIAYNTSGSKYAKSWPEIGANAVIDLGSNAGAEILNNWRKASRLRGEIVNPTSDVGRVIALEEETNALTKGVNEMQSYLNNMVPKSAVRKQIESLPESSMKNELLAATAGDVANIDMAKVRNIVGQYSAELNPHVQSLYRKEDAGEIGRMANNERYLPDATPYMQHVLTTPTDLNKIQRVQKAGLKLFDYAKKYASTPAEKLAGREATKSFTPKKDQQDNIIANVLHQQELDDTIDRIISNYSILWNKEKKPMGYDNPLIKKAYDTWKKEQK